MRLLYSALYYLLLPLIVVRLLWRSRKAPAYRKRLAERLGYFTPPADDKPTLWLHAVSVGETVAATPLIEHLLAQHSHCRIVVTTTTPTGSERVQDLFGGRVFHVYAPWDTPDAVSRFFARVKPLALIVMETELWPNMLHYAKLRAVPVMVANARLSAGSARGYQRVSALTRPMLDTIQTLACQSQADADRFLALGANKETIKVTGSIKFDIALDEQIKTRSGQLRAQWQADNRPVIVAASTHEGEDTIILDAFEQLQKEVQNALLVLVPRHPERFNAVKQLCETRYPGAVVHRSQGKPPEANHRVIVGDTMGELLLLLSTARVALIGGSFIDHGGHNVLEAAVWGVPVITGPWMYNFAQISDLMLEAGAMLKLQNPDQLPGALKDLASDTSRCAAMGESAKMVTNKNRGAQQTLEHIVDALIQAI